MFTRYATFIFLVGLSALFFTSGRSAPTGGEARKEPLRSVAAAEGDPTFDSSDLGKMDGAPFGGSSRDRRVAGP
jgi:hypothetical protein